jgi:ABC-type branched-subunit amino acid transport system ATPase component
LRLTVENVVKRFGSVTVLDGVSMEVPSGSIVGLIGPNGSGKSTLFDVISGFALRDSGDVRLDEESIASLTPYKVVRRGLARTFQVPRVARQMTVLENLMVAPSAGAGERLVRLFSPFHVNRIKRDEADRLERAWALVRVIGLERHANELAGTLSGGQTKLLSAGIVEMLDAEVLLLDEPTAGVHPALIEHIVELITRRQANARTTFVVEHNISVISRICETVYVLDVGRVIAHGVPSDIQNNESVIAAYLGRRAEQKTVRSA